MVHEHEVTREREVRTRTNGDAVDRRHRRLVELPELPDERLHADAQRLRGGAGVETLPAGLGDRRRPEVHAGAEGVARARDQQRPDVGVGAGGPDRVDELVAHLDGERVLRLGALEGDAADVVGARLDAKHRPPTGWS